MNILVRFLTYTEMEIRHFRRTAALMNYTYFFELHEMNMQASMLSDDSPDRRFSNRRPALLKARSLRALVAGIANTFRAILLNIGYLALFAFHHSNIAFVINWHISKLCDEVTEAGTYTELFIFSFCNPVSTTAAAAAIFVNMIARIRNV